MAAIKSKGVIVVSVLAASVAFGVLSGPASSSEGAVRESKGNSFVDDKRNMEESLTDFNIENGVTRQNLDNYFFGANRGGSRLFRGHGEVLMNKKVEINDNARNPYYNAFKPIIPDYYLQEYSSVMQRYSKEYGRTINPRVNLSNLWVGQSLDYVGEGGLYQEPALSGISTFSFLGHDVALKYVSPSRDYADLALWMASGVSEIDGYLTRVISENTTSLKSFRPTKFCSQEDLLEISWRGNKYIDDIHPAIAKVLAKADVSSVHDMNIDLKKYLKGKELVVSDASAKKKLMMALDRVGINATVVVGKGLIPRTPIDDTYFSVKRSEDEMSSIRNDYWGYESSVAELYKYRTFPMNDIRLSKVGATMSDVLQQRAMKERSIKECSLSLL